MEEEIEIFTHDGRGFGKSQLLLKHLEMLELQGYVLSKTKEDILWDWKEKGFAVISILGSIEKKKSCNPR